MDVATAQSDQLARSLGGAWTGPERGTLTERAALWGAAATRLGTVAIPRAAMSSMSRLVQWITRFAPAPSWETVRQAMFSKVLTLLDADVLMQPEPDNDTVASTRAHTRLSFFSPIFKEFQLMVDAGDTKQYPGFSRMGARNPLRTISALAMHTAMEGGTAIEDMSTLPVLCPPDGLQAAGAALCCSKSGDDVAGFVDAFNDAVCFSGLNWQQGLANMFPSGALAPCHTLCYAQHKHFPKNSPYMREACSGTF